MVAAGPPWGYRGRKERREQSTVSSWAQQIPPKVSAIPWYCITQGLLQIATSFLHPFMYWPKVWPVPQVHICTFAFSLILFLERASSFDLSFFFFFLPAMSSSLCLSHMWTHRKWPHAKINIWDLPGSPWLRLRAPSSRSPGSITCQGTRSHVSQLRPGAAKLIKKRKSFLSDSVHFSCVSMSHHPAFLFPPSECSWLMEHVVVTFSQIATREWSWTVCETHWRCAVRLLSYVLKPERFINFPSRTPFIMAASIKVVKTAFGVAYLNLLMSICEMYAYLQR